MSLVPQDLDWCAEMQLTPEQQEHERKILRAHEAILRAVLPDDLNRACDELYFLIANRDRHVMMALEDQRLDRVGL
jgi:hypothetical protein